MDVRDDFEMMRAIINQSREMTLPTEYNHPLMEMLKFQTRLLRRARYKDFIPVEKLRMCKIVYSNIVDILKMKFSKEKILVSKTGINYIQNIILPDLINLIESVLGDKYNPNYPEVLDVINPHRDGFRIYVIGNIRSYNEEYMSIFMNGQMGLKAVEEGCHDIDFIHNEKINQYLSYITGYIKTYDEANRDNEKDEELLVAYTKYNYFEELKNRDKLFRVPYDSYKHILDFINQMCHHEEISHIYITLYRVNTNSVIIEYLKEAALLDKVVTVFIEPNARGDEDQNYAIMKDLMCIQNINVIYGIPKFKVHAKMFLAIGHNVAYGHFGTGNYNESTSKRYVDTHLLTAQGNIINPALMIFNWFCYANEYNDASMNIRKYIYPAPFDKLWLSPVNVKSNIIGLILGEIQKGEKGRIFIKCNMLTDKEVIYYLNHAAIAGVNIRIYARSACLFDIPVSPEGVHMNNVHIYSLCGHYLEHDRIYRFGDRTFIASADLAFRNMHKRVETFVEITDDSIAQKVDSIFLSITTQYPCFVKRAGSKMDQNQWDMLGNE